MVPLFEKDDEPNLFNQTEKLPIEVVKILDSFSKEENEYSICLKLEIALQSAGYTIEWGLDAEPYNLKKLKLVT